MASASTSRFQLQHNQHNLQGIAWKTQEPVATVCLIHGFGEHAGRYHHVAEVFNKHQLNLYGLDLIGHGRSDGRRGDIPSFQTLIEEVDLLLKKTNQDFPQLPVFLYGHSMGGCVVSKYILSKDLPPMLNGALITSPWLRLIHPAPKFKLTMGKFLLNLGINISENANLNPENLSRDPQVAKDYKEDPLVHGMISARTFIEVSGAGEWVIANAHELDLPVLVAHGDDDQVTDFKASVEVTEKMGGKTDFKAWHGLRHETHNETNNKEVLQVYADWLVSQLQK